MKTPRHIAIENAAEEAVEQMEQSIRLVNDNDFNLALRDLRLALNLKQDKEPTFYVLTIDNGSGLISSIHRTREGANIALFRYVEENWHAVMDADQTIPADSEAAIAAYFAEFDDRAEIQPCEVED